MKNNSQNINYLTGNQKIHSIAVEPFNNEVCNFIADLSKNLDNNPKSKLFPDIKTLAFWCRKSNLLNLRKNFLTKEIRLGLGLIFHITPSNIPTNFAYSLLFGLITGNSNIVKVPSKKFDQVEIISGTINKILKNKYKLVKKMISIVRYSDNDNFTKKISAFCDTRIIWGGDTTIKNIRKFPLKERSLELTFADRYSLCVINSQKLLELDDYNITILSNKFFNDTYLVDQNACSSPHLILWKGKNITQARKKFWNSLKKIVSKRYDLSDKASMDKFFQLHRDIINLNNIKNYSSHGNFINNILLNKLDTNTHQLRGKWGYFYEFELINLNQIKKIINNKYQTLTYYGFNKKTLKNFFLKNRLKGIDRIVPIGQALDINFFWDGYDLSRILTRVVDIK